MRIPIISWSVLKALLWGGLLAGIACFVVPLKGNAENPALLACLGIAACGFLATIVAETIHALNDAKLVTDTKRLVGPPLRGNTLDTAIRSLILPHQVIRVLRWNAAPLPMGVHGEQKLVQVVRSVCGCLDASASFQIGRAEITEIGKRRATAVVMRIPLRGAELVYVLRSCREDAAAFFVWSAAYTPSLLLSWLFLLVRLTVKAGLLLAIFTFLGCLISHWITLLGVTLVAGILLLELPLNVGPTIFRATAKPPDVVGLMLGTDADTIIRDRANNAKVAMIHGEFLRALSNQTKPQRNIPLASATSGAASTSNIASGPVVSGPVVSGRLTSTPSHASAGRRPKVSRITLR